MQRLSNYSPKDRHDFTMFYCIKSKCFSVVTNMSIKKLLKLKFIIHFSRIQAIDVLKALTTLGLEQAGLLFMKLISNTPLISNKLTNNWTEEEDNALFWSFLHNNPILGKNIHGRSFNAVLSRMNRWIFWLQESQLSDLILKQRYVIEKSEIDNTLDQDLIQTSLNLTERNKLPSEETNDVQAMAPTKTYVSKRILKEKKKNQLAEARKNKAEIIKVRNETENKSTSQKEMITEQEEQTKMFHPLLLSVWKKSNDNLKRRKPIYDSELKMFWIRVHTFGRKCFDFFAKMFHGPSHSSIISWLKNTNFLKWNDFLNIDNIPTILGYFDKKNELLNSTLLLSIDAMMVDEDICIDHTGQVDGLINIKTVPNPQKYRQCHQTYLQLWDEMKKHNEIARELYVISACPINRLQTFPIHIFLASKKNNNNPVGIVKEVIKKFTRYNICIQYVGSDSDTKYREEFNEQYNEWSKYISLKDGNVMNINKPLLMWTSDAAHLLKRGRSRLVIHKTLYTSRVDQLSFESDPNNPVYNSHMINYNILHLINPQLSLNWFKNNGRDSMDDYYPHYIFSGKTLLGILNSMNSQNNQKHILSYIIPMLCIVRILRDKNAKRNLRLKWAYVSLFIMLFHHSWLKLQCAEKENKRENYSSYFTMDMCVDCANWLFSIIHILGEVNDSFSMSKVGSITSEHQFSQIRYYAGKEQTCRSIRFAFDRIMIMKELGDSYKEKFEKRMFRCAKIEEGTVMLSQVEIDICKNIAYKISLMSGILFPRECEFYDLVKDINLESKNEFNNTEINLINTLINDDFETKNNPISWRIQSSRFRIGPHKVGRNISMRYATALSDTNEKKQTQQEDEKK